MTTKLFIVLSLATFVFGDFNLVVLHTNDVHARVEQTSKNGQKCFEQLRVAGGCYGGVARRHTAIQEIRRNYSNVLLLDAGDQFQGTLWFAKYEGLETSYFMNKLGYDAMSLGNHEFDLGPEGLLPFAQNATFPILGCNVDLSIDPDLQNLIRRYVIIDVSGEKIGVIGYLTKKTESLGDPELLFDVGFSEIAPCIRESVQLLQDQGINKIIALGHSGHLSGLKEVATIPGVDIVVEGHSNTFLFNGEDEPPGSERSVGPYPTVVSQSDGGKALVYQAYAYGKYLGMADITFDDAGRVKEWKGNPILLDSSWQEDPEMLTEVEKWSQPLLRLAEIVVGHTAVLLQGGFYHCRLNECNLGNLVADAILHSRVRLSNTTGWNDVGIAIMNGGGVRKSLKKGSVTFKDLEEVHPWRNTVEQVSISGGTLKSVLEHSASLYRPDRPHGGFLHVSGLRVVYDMSQPEGSRVVEVHTTCTECDVPRFLPLNVNTIYNVLFPDFLILGGDGYTMLRDGVIKRDYIGVPVINVLEGYFWKMSPVFLGVEGRLTLRNGSSSSTTDTTMAPGRSTDELGIKTTPKSVSNLDRFAAETALFLLVAVCFVLLLTVIMLLVNYCGLKKQLRRMQDKKSRASTS